MILHYFLPPWLPMRAQRVIEVKSKKNAKRITGIGQLIPCSQYPVPEIRSMILSWRSGLIPDFVDLDILRDGLTVSPVTLWFSANGETAILDIWRFKTAKPPNRHVIFHSPALPSSLDLLDILALLVRLSSPLTSYLFLLPSSLIPLPFFLLLVFAKTWA